MGEGGGEGICRHAMAAISGTMGWPAGKRLAREHVEWEVLDRDENPGSPSPIATKLRFKMAL